MKAGVASRLDMSRLGRTRRDSVRIPMVLRSGPAVLILSAQKSAAAELPEATVLSAVLDGA